MLLAPGIIGTLLGLTALLPRGMGRFDREARQLLLGKSALPVGQSALVSLSPACVTISGRAETDGGVQEERRDIPYAEVLYAIETEDLFLLTGQRSGILLQKKDLVEGSLEDLRVFLSEKAVYTLV